jgi:hypothetical protein
LTAARSPRVVGVGFASQKQAVLVFETDAAEPPPEAASLLLF